jgi:F420-dependent oxidoreductase-like protein
MQLRIFIEPQQGTTYDDVLALASTAERLGFDGFFSSDHYMVMGGGAGLPGPTDAWTTLAGLARDTSRLRLGTLVTPVTFRLPGPLAIAVAQIDAMSGGRVELGLGTGWYEDEHKAYGVPFPPLGERFERLEEYLAVVTGLWGTPEGERFSHEGRHYRVEDSPALPKPAQRPRPPIVLGGGGPRRTPRLAARYADDFNTPFHPLDRATAQHDRVRAAAEAIGRDPTSIVYSVALVCVCGSTEDEFRRRAAVVGREPGELRQNGACGLPEEVVDTLTRFRDAGVSRVYLQHLDITDTDQVELLAAEVAPNL